MFCTNCGNEILEGSKFCTKCGAPLDSAAINAPAEAKPVSDKAAGDTPAAGPAPSKKKRTGLVVGVVAAVLVALAAVSIAVANPFAAPAPEPELGSVEAPDPQPAPEPAPEPESDPAADPEPEPALTIPNRYFISGTNFHPSGAYDVCLTDLGERGHLREPDMKPMGSFSEGKVLVAGRRASTTRNGTPSSTR